MNIKKEGCLVPALFRIPPFFLLFLALQIIASLNLVAAEGGVKQYPVPWKPIPPEGIKRKTMLALERDVFEPGDKMGRFVVGVLAGKAAELAQKEVRWVVRKEGTEIGSDTGSLAEGMLVVDFPIKSLAFGKYEVEAEILQDGVSVENLKRTFEVREDSGEAPSKKGRIPLIFPSGIPGTSVGYPVSFGVPMPNGDIAGLTDLRVVDAAGKAVPAQFSVRSKWGFAEDAGIRWLGVDIQVPKTGAGAWWPERKETPYFLEFGGGGVKNPVANPALAVTQTEKGIEVNTGPLRFMVRKDGYNLIDEVFLNNKPVMDQKGQGGGYLVDQEGAIYRTANDKAPVVSIEEQGPLRVVIRVEGWYVKDGTTGETLNYTLPTDKLCKFVSRVEAYAGLPWVRVLHSWVNTSDSFSVSFDDVGFNLIRPDNAQATFGVDGAPPIQQNVDKGVYLIQHLDNAFAVCREDGKELSAGKRSDGMVSAATKDGKLLTVANREMWERFPKEMEVLPGEMRFHVWPAHGRNHPEIDPFSKERYHQFWFAHQGKKLSLIFPWKSLLAVLRDVNDPGAPGDSTGVSMAQNGIHATAMGTSITTDLMIRFGEAGSGAAAATADAQAFEQQPLTGVHPDWVSKSMALGLVHPYDPEQFPVYEKAAQDAMFGIWNLQDITGEYGMYLYRLWHSSPAYLGNGYWMPRRIYGSGHHYQNYIPWLYFARSGDPLHGVIGLATLRQTTDVGMIHYADPKYPFKDESNQRLVVGASRHESGFVPWGGDHAILGHMTWYGATLLAYYITGDLRFHEVVDEWQHTLLEDSNKPEWLADTPTMNWNGVVPAFNRHSNLAAGELTDLYQMTYDPRILPILQMGVDDMEQRLTPWGRSVTIVLLFRRSPTLKKYLAEGVESIRDDLAHGGLRESISGQQNITSDRLALAAWANPGKGYSRDAWFAMNAGQQEWFGESFTGGWSSRAPLSDAIADRFLEMPMGLYVAQPVYDKDKSAYAPLGAPHVLPIPDEGKMARVVVKEDVDGDFTIRLGGRLQSDNAWLKVVDGNGKVVHDAAVAKGKRPDSPPPAMGEGWAFSRAMVRGDEFTVTIPKDGYVGEYTLLLTLHWKKDVVELPLTSLPGEIYAVQQMYQAPIQWHYFYLGAPNGPDGTVVSGDTQKAVVLESLDHKTTFGKDQTTTSTSFSVPFPPGGVWFRTTNGGAFYAPKNEPWLFSISPEKFFTPSAAALSAQ